MIKIISLSIIGLFLISFSNQIKEKKLTISLSFIQSEHSKDSHTNTEKFKLINGNLEYLTTSNHGEAISKGTEQKLTKPEIQNIVKIIEDNNLMRNVAQPKQTEYEIPYTSILVKCEITYGKKMGNINTYSLLDKAPKNSDYVAITKLKRALVSLLKGPMIDKK